MSNLLGSYSSGFDNACHKLRFLYKEKQTEIKEDLTEEIGSSHETDKRVFLFT